MMMKSNTWFVKKIHFAVGHGGRDKMIKEANKKYANVSIEALEQFIDFIIMGFSAFYDLCYITTLQHFIPT
jgi:hypothetical protein